MRRRTSCSSDGFSSPPARLKEVAGQYAVSYPTVRLRLDRLIQKIKISEEAAGEPYIALIRRLAVGEKIEVDAAGS